MKFKNILFDFDDTLVDFMMLRKSVLQFSAEI